MHSVKTWALKEITCILNSINPHSKRNFYPLVYKSIRNGASSACRFKSLEVYSCFTFFYAFLFFLFFNCLCLDLYVLSAQNIYFIKVYLLLNSGAHTPTHPCFIYYRIKFRTEPEVVTSSWVSYVRVCPHENLNNDSFLFIY